MVNLGLELPGKVERRQCRKQNLLEIHYVVAFAKQNLLFNSWYEVGKVFPFRFIPV